MRGIVSAVLTIITTLRMRATSIIEDTKKEEEKVRTGWMGGRRRRWLHRTQVKLGGILSGS